MIDSVKGETSTTLDEKMLATFEVGPCQEAD